MRVSKEQAADNRRRILVAAAAVAIERSLCFQRCWGALILARAVSDESLSRRILKAAAHRLPATTR